MRDKMPTWMKEAVFGAGVIGALGGAPIEAKARPPTHETYKNSDDAFDGLNKKIKYGVTLDTRDEVKDAKKEIFERKYNSLLGKMKMILSLLEKSGKITEDKSDSVYTRFQQVFDSTLNDPKIKGSSAAEAEVFRVFAEHADMFLAKIQVEIASKKSGTPGNAKVEKVPDAFEDLDRTSAGIKDFLDPNVDFDTAINKLGTAFDGENGVVGYNGIQFVKKGDLYSWRVDGVSKEVTLTNESRGELIQLLQSIHERMKADFGVDYPAG